MGAKVAQPEKTCINVWDGSTDISGNYADMAKAFGGHGERVTDPGEIRAALDRGPAATQEGKPALVEFITDKEIAISNEQYGQVPEERITDDYGPQVRDRLEAIARLTRERPAEIKDVLEAKVGNK